MTMPAPSRWQFTPIAPPAVGAISTGGAELTVWAYPTASPISSDGDAEAARSRLIESLRARDPKFELESSKVRLVGGLPAVEIRGRTKMAGKPLEVRSVHLYFGRAEYVLDALADPDAFERADELVFSKVIAGFHGRGEPPAAGGGAAPGASPAPEG